MLSVGRSSCHTGFLDLERTHITMSSKVDVRHLRLTCCRIFSDYVLCTLFNQGAVPVPNDADADGKLLRL